MKPPIRYCAAYTRKSTEEGLEQEFNTLDAQREACLAYIASQKIEGWVALPDQYDDGGFSGGNIERPALQQLLADIKAGKVHTVVVYKIDRLTRSLMDFAKLVEIFDQYGVTFVSVTQAFSTTTSMGRLTLNVLLSFAQFEREVIGERVRDKIAASKQKGMWMGGNNPVGYQRVNKQLVPYEPERDTVRMIFEGYLETGCLNLLHNRLLVIGIQSRERVSSKGVQHGGRPFSQGALHHILTNPVYIGKIRHKTKVYDGLHEPLISQELWDRVQTALQNQAPRKRGLRMAKDTNLLQGLLFDVTGVIYSPSFTNKGPDKRRYRYYISRNEKIKKPMPAGVPFRLPAQETEELVERTIREHLSGIHMCAELLGVDIVENHQALAQITQKQGCIKAGALLSCVDQIAVKPESLVISITSSNLCELMEKNLDIKLAAIRTESFNLTAAMKPVRGKRGTLVVLPQNTKTDMLDMAPSELKKLVQGFVWMEEHLSGKTIENIALHQNISPSYVGSQIMKVLNISSK